MDDGSYLKHYGIIRRSGRYPWGSSGWGEDTLRGNVSKMKAQGMSEKDIAQSVGVTVAQLRADISAEKEETRLNMIADATKLNAKKYSNTAIAQKLGVTEGTVRNLLKAPTKYENDILSSTKKVLRDAVKEKKYLDVGQGTEQYLGISGQRLDTALRKLKEEGYEIIKFQQLQLGTNKQTTIKVLCAPGTTFQEVMDNRGNIRTIPNYSTDNGKTFFGIKPPVPVDSSRVKIMYAEDGGTSRDGVIYLKNNAPDLSLGENRYGQVRINVDNTHYIKGMAIQVPPNQIPKGYDIVVWSNKAKADGLPGALKPIKDDPDNPFGAIIRQTTYKDKHGKEQLSPINIVGYEGTPGSGVEGSWDKWSRNLASQFLSKQPVSVAQKQLNISLQSKEEELKEILNLNNPTIKRTLLEAYADDCDASAVSLKAAKFPRQATQMLLPLTNISPTEIYAPNFKTGEEVVLVRYPHGGRFEIPLLRVNNANKEGMEILGNAKDAVGISSVVAEKLSGADFDGDTAVVIPNPRGLGLKVAPTLDGLKNFDPKKLYSIPKDIVLKMEDEKLGSYGTIKLMGKPGGGKTNMEMGKISNLITDMSIQGADANELARAIRHSMVVIDAEKHKLDYKRSEIDNNIKELRDKYQGGDAVSIVLDDNKNPVVSRKPKKSSGGASTLISRSKSTQRDLPKVKAQTIDPKTGKIKRVYVNEKFVDKQGKEKLRTQEEYKMNLLDDAYLLTSTGNKATAYPIERVYAEYANSLKGLAITARKVAANAKDVEYSPTANKQYAEQVASLDAKLRLVKQNAPLERQAQLIASQVIRSKIKTNPKLKEDKEVLKKMKYQALAEARNRTGAKKNLIFIEDDEWEAIRKGAITKTAFKAIIDAADLERLKELSTPREKARTPQIVQSQIAQMWNRGYSAEQIANMLGISIATVNKYK